MSKSIPWSYTPYKPFLFESGDIYISRIVPAENSISFEWQGEEGVRYDIHYRKRGCPDFASVKNVQGNCYTLPNLKTDTDYEFQVSTDDRKSRLRLARTGKSVGIVVNYLHPEDNVYSFSGHYLCSPSLVRHPDGYLLASMDLFEGNGGQNLNLIFRSDDDGETWHYVTELMPSFWGKLFIHHNDVYMLSCSTEYGDLLIGRSTDGGKTFGSPTVLLRGGGRCHLTGVHKNPQNVIRYNGRIYETLEWGSWRCGYHAAMVMSCDENADLLDAANWSFTPPVKYNPDWEGVAKGPSSGNIEGTLVVSPEGKLLNIMRYDTTKTVPSYGLVLAYEVDTENPSAPLTYSHAIEFPANLSKFMIKRDIRTGTYYSIVSRIYDSEKTGARNLLSLMCSKDLIKWDVCGDLIDMRNTDPKKIGFQYVDFEIENDDIMFLCRTAMNHAHNFHDSNYMTFHRIKNFRDLYEGKDF